MLAQSKDSLDRPVKLNLVTLLRALQSEPQHHNKCKVDKLDLIRIMKSFAVKLIEWLIGSTVVYYLCSNT